MRSTPPPPPPLPPLPKFSCTANPAIKRPSVVSVTNQEIAMYWRQRSMVEEDHLLAAIKAAARIRARNLSVSFIVEFLLQTQKFEDPGKMAFKNYHELHLSSVLLDTETKILI